MKKKIITGVLVLTVAIASYLTGVSVERRAHKKAEHAWAEDGLVLVGDGGIRVTNMQGQDFCLPLQPEAKSKVLKIIYLQQASSPTP